MGQDRMRPEGRPQAGKFWKRPKIRTELKLTDDQVRDFEEIFLRNRKALIDLKADVEKKQLDLDEAISDNRSDDKKLAAQVDVVEQARGRLGKARAMMMIEMRRVLSPEQRERLEQLRAERDDQQGPGMRERGPHGGGTRGRPGPPPPPPEDEEGE